jgi:hypothetical protein
MTTGANLEISINGTVRTYRDEKGHSDHGVQARDLPTGAARAGEPLQSEDHLPRAKIIGRATCPVA